jgi:hypothetical protein
MSVMRRSSLAALSLLAAVVAAAAVGLPRAGPGPPATPSVYAATPLPPLLGIVGKGEAQELARIDPETLLAQGRRRVGVGSGGCASRSGGQACWTLPPWSFAPHERLLALARNEHAGARSLRVVDVRRMRVRTDVPLAGGAVGMLAWLAPRRVLMVQEICCKARQQLVAVDLARRHVVARQPLAPRAWRQHPARRAHGAGARPAGHSGAGHRKMADRSGAMRSVRLERIARGCEAAARRGLPGRAERPRARRLRLRRPHAFPPLRWPRGADPRGLPRPRLRRHSAT